MDRVKRAAGAIVAGLADGSLVPDPPLAKDDGVALPNRAGLRWTADKPTHPGWYFTRSKWDDRPVVVRVFWCEEHRDWLFELRAMFEEGSHRRLSVYADEWSAEWAGPIPEPEGE